MANDFRTSMPAGGAGINTLDAFISGGENEGSDYDANSIGQAPKRPAFNGEQRLCLAVLEDAIRDADNSARGFERRRVARLWLRGAKARITARECCEILELDYDVLLEKLERLWLKVED